MSAPARRWIVERATEADAAAIRELIKEGRVNPTSLDWRNFTVARDPELGLVGCGQIRDIPGGGGRELKSLVVRSGFRDGAVSRALLRALIEGEQGVVWGTCVETLAPYYLRFGCDVPPKAEIPRYYRSMSPVAWLIHRLAGGHVPKMVVLRFHPPGTAGT